MNERIIEMAIAAGFNPVNCTGSNVPLFEKFAKLIVRECVGVIESGRFLHDQAPTAIFAKECSGAVKRHFGVEE